MTCYNIIQSLPEDKRNRVARWYDEPWEYEKFLEKMKSQFENKQARQAAGSKLSRIRMEASQYFDDFLDDYEYTLGIAGEANFTNASKIISLNALINASLKRQLVTLDLPDEDYDTWVKQVRVVAGRLEFLPEYRPKGDKNTTTWYLSEPGLTPNTPAQNGPQEAVDRDGDVAMEEVNHIDINSLAAAIHAFATGGRPRIQRKNQQKNRRPVATWLFQNEIERLKSKGLYFRCKKSGHSAR
jgi:hypothetical protein